MRTCGRSLASGDLVQVNGHDINVFAAGAGQKVVFLAGFGTSAPVLDFKPLWSRLVDHCRVVVVERAGYGFSPVQPGLKRDTDSVLEETRRALFKAGQEPPYVLAPHSMAGLEALYWARRYPAEVTRIIGLDMVIPEIYDHLPLPPLWLLKLVSAAGALGLIRLFPSVGRFPLFRSGELTAEEIKVFKKLLYTKTLTANMLAEMASLRDNARFVHSQGTPKDTPLTLFISREQAQVTAAWEKLLTAYCGQVKDAEYMVLAAGHYLHHQQAEYLAAEIRRRCVPVVPGR